jgi:HAD superfamily hydrolase (TIGR01549 family)
MKIKYLLLDMDGTIAKFKLDYLGPRRRALQVLKGRGLLLSGFNEQMSIYQMLKLLKGHVSDEELHKLRSEFYHMIEEAELKAALEAELVPNALETLSKLKAMGLKLAIVTNNGRLGTEITLERLNITSFFDVVITRDDSAELKPDGGIIEKALNLLHATKDEALFIGDSMIDIQASRAAGVSCVALPTGPFSVHKLLEVEPDFIISSFKELPELLERISQV